MESKQVQLYLDREKMIEASPVTSAECVILSDGNDLQKVLDNDLTNPTVVHEETSFKVGVGDINVSSSVVDGEVGRMVIKGKTYQNILPEPSTHVLTNNKEMFKVNEGLDPNVEIVDGVSKSAILKGQTLVNLAPKVEDSVISNYQSGNVILTSEFKPLTNLKANTEYTVLFKASNVVNATNGMYQYQGRDTENVFIKYNIKNYTLVNGYNKLTFTPSVEISKIQFLSYNTLSVGGSCCIHGDSIMIIEGDYTNVDIPYFEGMQSVKMPVLTTTTSQNLSSVPFSFFEKTTDRKYGAWTIFEFDNLFSGKIILNKRPFNTIMYFDTKENRLNIGTTVVKDVQFIGFYNSSTNIENNNKGNLLELLESGELDISLQENGKTNVYSYKKNDKTNILSTSEDVTLRGIGEVRDTLDLLTGELTERVGETVLNGGENWVLTRNNSITSVFELNNNLNTTTNKDLICDKIDGTFYSSFTDGKEAIKYTTRLFINILNSKATTVNELKIYLKSNPITIQYELATPIIKTVDLSTSGNWEKVVLDGKSSENWQQNTHSGNFVQFEGYSNFCLYSLNLPLVNRGLLCDKLSYYGYDSGFRQKGIEGISDGGGYKLIFVRVKTEKLPTNDVAGFKQWLSQNPIEVSYMLSSNKDSTQVKQPIFFKDGHIQLSSGADNSLIPTLDYQAKTSNSYVMDLMKANTRYTMKAKSASGTFTIDGTSYGAGTNGTFTTPSSMTNKLLVMSDTAHEEVMILEGDVTSKTIPYFKGIKSAFEDEDKIEVLSTGKNLFDGVFEKGIIEANGNLGYSTTAIRTVNYISVKPNTSYHINLVNLESFESFKVVYVHEYDKNYKVLREMQVDNRGVYTSQSETRFIKINTHDNNNLPVDSKMIVCKNSTNEQQYESYKSNNTKIPLLLSLQTVVEDVHMTQGSLDNATGVELVDTTCVRSNFIEVAEDTPIAFRNGGLERMAHILAYDSKKRYVEKLGIVSSCSIPQDKDIKYVRIFMNANNYEKLTISKYIKAYNGLASLPNGVCDELIVDRTKKKATLIQRIKSTVFNGSEDWNSSSYSHDKLVEFVYHGGVQIAHTVFSDRFATGGVDVERVAFSGRSIYIRILKTKVSNVDSFKKWLSQNPLTVQYGLQTPLITEIDLESFPLVYKDGHIFLNSEIAPVVEIDYNVNQSQQIQANNETLQRHELDILDLDNLIVSFVDCEYRLRLLKFDMELSMMALAE